MPVTDPYLLGDLGEVELVGLDLVADRANCDAIVEIIASTICRAHGIMVELDCLLEASVASRTAW